MDWPGSGSYLVAVSGGVDSMALLHMFNQKNTGQWRLNVAHFDHGIRLDSVDDRKLVQATAKKYGLPFMYEEAKLGPKTSEAKARLARYSFLRRVLTQTNSQAIITAHHQDDVIETAIINMLRGTGRKGLTALHNRADIIRPLLKISKRELINYAKNHQLPWNEDMTNQDKSYLRNWIRHEILPKLSLKQSEQLLKRIEIVRGINSEIDSMLSQLGDGLSRSWFDQLPHEVAKEVLASWLRQNSIRSFDRPMLERLVVSAKVAGSGKIFPIARGRYLKVEADNLALSNGEC